MNDFNRIITVMEEQITLCGPDCEHDRVTVYMTADDSKRIVKWLKAIERPEIIQCKDCQFHDSGENEVDEWNRCRLHSINTNNEAYCSWAIRSNYDKDN